MSTVNYHLQQIFGSQELTEETTIGIFPIVRQEGSRQVTRQIQHYNLDAIISVGYRVNSIRATQFRQWAIGILRDFVHEKLADLRRIFKAHLNLAESRAVRHILTRM